MKDLCKICHGAGNLFCRQAGAYEWYICPACGGAGVRATGFPSEIRISPAQMKYCKPEPSPSRMGRGG